MDWMGGFGVVGGKGRVYEYIHTYYTYIHFSVIRWMDKVN
jgi:hypothetical protein